MACASTCPTKDHDTFGACVRAKGLHLGDVKGSGQTAARDLRLNSYYDARQQGIQPETTRLRDVQKAVRVSDATGRAFDASPA